MRGSSNYYSMKQNLNSEGYDPMGSGFEKNQSQNRNYFGRMPDIALPNFFELKPVLEVVNPYSLEESLKRIEELTEDDIKNDMSFFAKKEFEFRNSEEKVKFLIDKLYILTSDIDENGKRRFIKLKDIREYCLYGESGEPRMDLEVVSNDFKKEISINVNVNYRKISENIDKNLCHPPDTYVGKFYKREDGTNNIFETDIEYYDSCYFDMIILLNSIKKVYYTEEFYLFDLQFPPIYKTNFLNIIDWERDQAPKNKTEKTLFPFRDFDNEVSNLKYRNFSILIEKRTITPEVFDESQRDVRGKKEKILFNYETTLLSSLRNVLENEKLEEITDSNFFNCIPEKLDVELDYFFNYKKDKKIRDFYIENKFLKENCEKEKEGIEVIKLCYQILAVVSENLLSYYNAIKFMEKFISTDFYKKKTFKEIFEECSIEKYPLFVNETLTRFLDANQSTQTQNSLAGFEQKLRDTFIVIFEEYKSLLNGGDDDTNAVKQITKPSKNDNLLRIQRVIVTPTYTYFTPYILEQGNRIIRDFLPDVNLSMMCVFKMDDFSEDRWSNKILIEFIKFVLNKGVSIGSHSFNFFNYSQSQFRNKSCWLTVNPELILPKTGDYSHIKVVAKYAARVSQTLTTTLKTIKINRDCVKKIDDVERKDENGEVIYTFSDGVGQISYSLAEKISKSIHLDFVPSAFQGRFLGCKGVWTTMYGEEGDFIKIRPSQTKFKFDSKEEEPFELCAYSRFIEADLNRQVILLLSSLGISDKVFMKKLENYKKKFQDETFVLSLIHYEEWGSMFREMNASGVNMRNDRLIKALVESNKMLLYQDLKSKARINIEEAAYVKGIMDEFGVLEYGEAFLHIKNPVTQFDFTLDKKCAIAKCPCLHPGDIRVLNFRKYHPDKKDTLKFKIFEKYENVLIFPQKGPRPHPNECSGSDLDGDDYFVFYDEELIPKETVEPMNYNFNVKAKTKDNITSQDIIEYFAEYINSNNLGMIAHAHLARSDLDPQGARGIIPMKLAEKFSRAVDAPKTGEKIELSKEEAVDSYPHFMEKTKRSYISKKILGQIYDRTKEYLFEISNPGGSYLERFYDKDLCLEGWEKFGLIALFFYREYFEEIRKVLMKNEIKLESILLTGNTTDNDLSVFTKKKHNYDIREKVANEMTEMFFKFKKCLTEITENFLPDQVENFDQAEAFLNGKHLLASACYMVSYNLNNLVTNPDESIKNFKDNLEEMLYEEVDREENKEWYSALEYESYSTGIDKFIVEENLVEEEEERKKKEKRRISRALIEKANILTQFLKQNSLRRLPHSVEEENESRILSFCWCISGKILSLMKKINRYK